MNSDHLTFMLTVNKMLNEKEVDTDIRAVKNQFKLH